MTPQASFSAVVIPQDPTLPIRRVEIGASGDTLGDLQGNVDGNVDVIPYASQPGVNVWINDEGKYTKDRNGRATALMIPGVDLFVGDWIAGDVVVTGEADAEGNTLGLEPGWETDSRRDLDLRPVVA